MSNALLASVAGAFLVGAAVLWGLFHVLAKRGKLKPRVVDGVALIPTVFGLFFLLGDVQNVHVLNGNLTTINQRISALQGLEKVRTRLTNQFLLAEDFFGQMAFACNKFVSGTQGDLPPEWRDIGKAVGFRVKGNCFRYENLRRRASVYGANPAIAVDNMTYREVEETLGALAHYDELIIHTQRTGLVVRTSQGVRDIERNIREFDGLRIESERRLVTLDEPVLWWIYLLALAAAMEVAKIGAGFTARRVSHR